MRTSSISPNGAGGFSLLEVMFAVTAFCIATFAILALVSQTIESARRLQRPMVDTSLVAAVVYAPTNQIDDDLCKDGNLGDILGDAYKGYSWEGCSHEIQTNRLWQADIRIWRNDGDKALVSQGTYWFYKPLSKPGKLDGATQ